MFPGVPCADLGWSSVCSWVQPSLAGLVCSPRWAASWGCCKLDRCKLGDVSCVFLLVELKLCTDGRGYPPLFHLSVEMLSLPAQSDWAQFVFCTTHNPLSSHVSGVRPAARLPADILLTAADGSRDGQVSE